MTSHDRVITALNHRAPDRMPIDFGGATVTGMHVSCVTALRAHSGLDRHPVRVSEIGQMLGEIEEDLRVVLGIDVEAVARAKSKWGFALDEWKPWRMPDGLEVLVPGGFNTTVDSNGDILLYPQEDLADMRVRAMATREHGRARDGGPRIEAAVRQQVLERGKVLADSGGYDFNSVYNVQARTPLENIVAMVDAVNELNT